MTVDRQCIQRQVSLLDTGQVLGFGKAFCKDQPLRINADVGYEPFCCADGVHCFHITRLVMALTYVSPTHQYSIRAFKKCIHYKGGINASGAHNPHYPDIRGILKARHPR